MRTDRMREGGQDAGENNHERDDHIYTRVR